MNKKYLVAFIIFIIHFICNGQQCDSCKFDFVKLLKILNKKQISEADLQSSWQITAKLYSLKYYDYDSIANNKTYALRSLTRTYADICIKSGVSRGVDYYLKYLQFTEGSAEEERSFCLERMFVRFPEIVFDRVGKNEELLESLTWGFLNNRFYGAKNPYDNIDYTAMTVYENGPKPILNKNNCKAIFFETNPSLIKKYNIYKYQIDYIINSAIEGLK